MYSVKELMPFVKTKLPLTRIEAVLILRELLNLMHQMEKYRAQHERALTSDNHAALVFANYQILLFVINLNDYHALDYFAERQALQLSDVYINQVGFCELTNEKQLLIIKWVCRAMTYANCEIHRHPEVLTDDIRHQFKIWNNEILNYYKKLKS